MKTCLDCRRSLPDSEFSERSPFCLDCVHTWWKDGPGWRESKFLKKKS